MRHRSRTVLVATVLGGLTLAAPSEAEKIRDQARFKVVSMSGTLAHTFSEEGWADLQKYDPATDEPLPTTRIDECYGSQSERVEYRSTEPFKAYVSLKTIPHRGLSTIVSSTADPENFDRVSVQGEMTLSNAVSYSATEGCRPAPVECPESTFSSPVIAFGTNLSNGGLATLWDPARLDLPPGLDRSCEPQLGAEHGPLSPGAVPPEESVIPGAISRADLFGKRKRLSGEGSREFAYETRTGPEYSPGHVTVTGTYGETVAVELKRLKSKKK